MIHGVDPNLNLGDITQVDEKKLNDFDLMTWGFPCTDLSAAGRQKGFIDENGNKTRSGMYYEGIRILREKKPKLSIIENVKALTSKKFAKEFQMILDDLMLKIMGFHKIEKECLLFQFVKILIMVNLNFLTLNHLKLD